jgi:hypothetical protein
MGVQPVRHRSSVGSFRRRMTCTSRLVPVPNSSLRVRNTAAVPCGPPVLVPGTTGPVCSIQQPATSTSANQTLTLLQERELVRGSVQGPLERTYTDVCMPQGSESCTLMPTEARHWSEPGASDTLTSHV